MRASRLVALLLHLQRGGATAAVLAERLEVSVRTVYRDVLALQEAGVPLWTEPGPGGGIRLLEGWRTRLDGLTADEAGALFLAGAPSAVAELGLGTVLAAAQAKVLSTLPPELQARAGRVQERFHLDAPGWFHREEPLPHLGTIADAVWGERRVDVRYRRPERTVRRRLDPLGLVLKGGIWYLVARHRRDIRTYRVGRLATAEARPERFVRPEGFDLVSWWRASSADFDRSILRERVRLRVSPTAQRRLPRLVEPSGAEAVEAAGPPDDRGGGRWTSQWSPSRSPSASSSPSAPRSRSSPRPRCAARSPSSPGPWRPETRPRTHANERDDLPHQDDPTGYVPCHHHLYDHGVWPDEVMEG